MKPDGVSNIGKAAHIAAAAAGGPRYISTMAPEQRGGIGNGIWLCSNCADMIDRDEQRYPAGLLHEWRCRAETTARAEQGKKLPSERELSVFRAKALGENVMGTSISELITGVFAIGAQEIERIDPRFTAKIRLDDNNTPIISLNPIEPVHCRLCIMSEVSQEFSEKLANLHNHGHRLEMDAEGIKMEGSPLFENIFPRPAKLVMETNFQRMALQRIHWRDVDSGKIKTAEAIGQIFGGTASITFTGELFGGLYHLSFQIPLTTSGLRDINTRASISLSSFWEGKTVRKLPYLDQFLSLCKAILDGQQIESCLEVDGQELITIKSISLMSRDETINMFRILSHLKKIRDILEALHTDIYFKLADISVDEAERISEIWFLLCRMKSLKGKDFRHVSARITLVPSNTGVNEITSSIQKSKPIFIKIRQELAAPLMLLGQSVPLSSLEITWSSAIVKLQGRLSSIRAGKPVRLKLSPTDDCTATISAENLAPFKEIAPISNK
jgi:hypothetical protein